MKILLFSAYPPARDGIGDYTKRLVTSLNTQGHTTTIIAPTGNFPHDSPNVYRDLSFSIRGIRKSLETMQRFQPDIIHVQYCLSLYGLSSFAILFILTIFKQRQPHCTRVVTLHELQREQERIGAIAKIFYFFFLKAFDGFMTHTAASKNILQTTYHIQDKKIKQIHFPVFEFAEKKLKASSAEKKLSLKNKFVILCFGFIQIDKGIQYLLHALNDPIVAKHKANIAIIIAGDVRKRTGIFKRFEKKDQLYKSELHEYVEKNGLKSIVTFTGFVDNSEVFSLFDRANLLIIPYTKIEHSSVFGMSLAAQKPIIASNVGGLGETLQGSGILVDPGNAHEIAAAIDKMITHPNEAKILVKQYEVINLASSQSSITKKTVAFYEKLSTNDK